MAQETHVDCTPEERKIIEDWRYEWQSKQGLLGSGALRGNNGTIWGIQSQNNNGLCFFHLYKIEEGKFNLDILNSRPTKDEYSVEVEVLKVPAIQNKVYEDLNQALSDVVDFFKADNSEEIIENYEEYIKDYFLKKEKDALNEVIPFQFFQQIRRCIGFNESNGERDFNCTVEKDKDGYVFKKLDTEEGKVLFSTTPTKNFHDFLQEVRTKVN